MNPVFGVAGPAAAGALAGWGLLCLGVALTWATAFFGLLLKSRAFAVLSAVFWTVATVPFRPWEAFLASRSSDWEAEDLADDFRLLAWLWIGATIGATTALVDTFRRRADRTV